MSDKEVYGIGHKEDAKCSLSRGNVTLSNNIVWDQC